MPLRGLGVAGVLSARWASLAAVKRTKKDQVVGVDFGCNVGQFNYHSLWLRDHCQCPSCLHKTTRQRLIDSSSIPLNIAASDARIDGEDLVVTWTDGPGLDAQSGVHESRYSADWLKANSYWKHTPGEAATALASAGKGLSLDPVADVSKRVEWGSAHFGPRSVPHADRFFPTVAHSDFMGTDEGLYMGLSMLRDYGFFCVEGVPVSMQGTEDACKRINFLRETLYGPGIWRTEVLPGGGNDTAFTGIPLPAHHDGCYWADPPGIQSFHCLKAADKGGESLLVDGFAVLAELRKSHPDTFRFFSENEFRFHHTDSEAEVHCTRPVIALDGSGNVTSFNFNNDDRAPLHLSPQLVLDFYRHLRNLTALLRSPKYELWLDLRPGTLLVFDNTRVLHGRSGFDTSSGRVLAGCYIGREDWHSRLRTVARKLGKYAPDTTLPPKAYQ